LKSLSDRALGIKPSATIAMDSRAKELMAQGVPIISLGAGEPDFSTPETIKNDAIAAIHGNKTRYTLPSGILELKEAVCSELKNRHHLHYDPAQIIISSGAKHGISNALSVLINPGDEVLIPSPCWVTYPELVKYYGGTPVLVPTHQSAGFKLRAKDLEGYITSATKLLILNNPNNPTGSTLNFAELAPIAELILEHDLWCVSDEIYEYICYQPQSLRSIAAFSPEMQQRTLIISGVSKAFAMTGWRIGYSASAPEVALAIARTQGQTTHHPANISQYAALSALSGNRETVTQMVNAFKARRDYAIASLQDIPGLLASIPEGAFYLFLNIQEFLNQAGALNFKNSVELCDYLLSSHHLALIPGEGFGAPGYIRLSYACSDANLKTGINRLKTALNLIKSNAS
jgi:aspartate aminotransferase